MDLRRQNYTGITAFCGESAAPLLADLIAALPHAGDVVLLGLAGPEASVATSSVLPASSALACGCPTRMKSRGGGADWLQAESKAASGRQAASAPASVAPLTFAMTVPAPVPAEYCPRDGVTP